MEAAIWAAGVFPSGEINTAVGSQSEAAKVKSCFSQALA